MAHLPQDHRNDEQMLRVLREIKKSPEMSQRELSSRLGISLGKANFLIRALMERGWVKMENFKASNQKTAYLYYLTPEGMEEKARTTYHFLKRKTKEYERLEEEIRQLRQEARESGLPVDDSGKGANKV